MATITIAYSNHRPEALRYTAEAMRRHEAVFLEEAPDPAFDAMLDGQLAIDDYLAGLDIEYPEFSRLSCRMIRELNAGGTRFEQVDPFIERLLRIHEMFASGTTPGDVQADLQLKDVYAAEKIATRRLIEFYAAAATKPFQTILDALKAFARVDAARFRFRYTLRADALALKIGHYSSSYIEAGSMHLWLRRSIKRKFSSVHAIRSHYPMAEAVRAITGRSYLMGPGDDLTLRYIYTPRADSPAIDLLAARALIFNKILTKTEIMDTTDDCPHTRDEWCALQKVNRLDMDDCGALFPHIRAVGTTKANTLVDAYLQQ